VAYWRASLRLKGQSKLGARLDKPEALGGLIGSMHEVRGGLLKAIPRAFTSIGQQP